MGSKGPSKNLSWAELKCADGTEYPIKWRKDRAVALAATFEEIRLACGGKPIEVSSGYRTKQYNAKINGARLSQHVQGRALDLKPPDGMSLEKFGNKILELANREGSRIKGFGWYKSWIHIDIRPTETLATWDFR